MKHTLYPAGFGMLLAGAAYAQDFAVGSKMPDPRKMGGIFVDNPIQQWKEHDCIIQINRYTNSEGKQFTILAAFPDMDWADRDKPYIIWDRVKNMFYIDNKRKDGKGKFADGRGPDGFIDEIVQGPVNILEKHPFCRG